MRGLLAFHHDSQEARPRIVARWAPRGDEVRDEKLTPWKVDTSETVLDERYLKVVRERVTTASGFVIPDYQLVVSPSWAATMCLTDQRELVLVRQYRHGHEGPSLELPAGIVEPGEDPKDAARRELFEETGYEPETLELFWRTRPEPARHRQLAHFAFARGARRTRPQALDASEDILVELHPVASLDRVVDQMVHAVHVAALLLAARRGLLAE